jgi:Nucleoside-diphosphate-sugar epimerases
VTGAGGFIGARVVEILASEALVTVRAIGHNYAGLVRAGQFDEDRVELTIADVREETAVLAAIEGCDVLVHCAYGSNGSPEDRWGVTVDGTEAALRAARTAGVGRFVFVGTVATYNSSAPRIAQSTEQIAVRSHDRSYAQAKLRARTIALQASDALDIVVVEPAVVYGPWGGDWSRGAIERLLNGDGAALPFGRGGGVCNAVHIDDVARALASVSLQTSVSTGRCYPISGPQLVTWGEYYDALRRITGAANVDPTWDGSQLAEWERELYESTAVVDSSSARADFDYDPVVHLDDGCRRLEEWAIWAGLLPGRSRSDGRV